MFKLRLKLLFVYLSLILYLIGPESSIAAPQLQATVDANQVMLGETLTLKLELSDTSASDKPDLSSLADSFAIDGQQQFQSTQFVNGQVSSQLIWQYTLEPKQTGVLTIPSLSLRTSAGYLRSQPIKITVSATPIKRDDNTRLETIVSNSNPYLHEPIRYTLRLYYHGELRDLEPIPPTKDVIMEALGQLSQRRTIINGKPMTVAQMSYILTPLRSGQLELGMGKMKGLKPDNRRSAFGSGFFSFNNYRVITLSSLPKTLEVQPPPLSLPQPWLPLKSLKLEQNWESDIGQPVVVGVPLVRTLTLIAAGMGGQSPPALDALVAAGPDFRVRSPKPEVERGLSADKKTPLSTIIQSFSLIPLRVGSLNLPAVRIPWWDVEKHSLAWAELPAQTIEVVNSSSFTSSGMTMVDMSTSFVVPRSQSIYLSRVQYVLLSLAVLVLLIALWQSWLLRRRGVVLLSETDDELSCMSGAAFSRRLSSMEALPAIKGLIQEYAHCRWQTPVNVPLGTLAGLLRERCQNGEAVGELFREFEVAWYGGQGEFDLTDWKRRCGTLLSHLKDRPVSKSRGRGRVVLEPLNPV